MRTLCGYVALLAIIVLPRGAAAHFLWLDVSPKQPATVNLWFSETLSPGDAKLLDKVSQTKTWIVDRDGAKQPLELKKQESDEQGAWTGAIEEAKSGTKAPANVDATCDYGVISRGGSTFLLQYYARHVIEKLHGDVGMKHSDFALDVKTWPEGNALGFLIQFEGKPATDAQLFVIGPDNEERELKLDQAGHVRLVNAAPGQYAVRAGLRQKLAGERDGKNYDEVRHWSTLTFELPQQQKAASANATDKNLVAENTLAANTSPKSADAAGKKSETGDPVAIELLRKAREGRAVWEKFPGFTADVTVALDGKQEKGSLSVDESTTSSAKLNDKVLREWVEEQASTLVQHRLPSGFDDEKPTFADDDKGHPLGRLIQLGDSGFSSAYRIRDNMVMEVNRHAGPVRFTISVLETEINKEGKYLPRVFTITTWDEKTGEMKSSSSYLNTWTRVGSFDMPERILEIETKPGDKHVRELTFSNYRLTETEKK